MSVNEICAALSLGQSATSQNLAALTRAGILVVEHKGANRIYRVRGPRIARILALIEEFCQVHELYGDCKRGQRCREGANRVMIALRYVEKDGGSWEVRTEKSIESLYQPAAVPRATGVSRACHPRSARGGRVNSDCE